MTIFKGFNKKDGKVKTAKQAVKKPLDKEAKPQQDKKALDPTRYGDWEKGGRCIDF